MRKCFSGLFLFLAIDLVGSFETVQFVHNHEHPREQLVVTTHESHAAP